MDFLQWHFLKNLPVLVNREMKFPHLLKLEEVKIRVVVYCKETHSKLQLLIVLEKMMGSIYQRV